MNTEIKVGPPVITISQGRTFMVTTRSGMIQAESDEGLYAVDTRFISSYQLYINHAPLHPVNSSQLTFYASRFHLTNPSIKTQGGTIEKNTINVTINRTISDSLCSMTLRFWREGEESHWEVSKMQADTGTAKGDLISVVHSA